MGSNIKWVQYANQRKSVCRETECEARWALLMYYKDVQKHAEYEILNGMSDGLLSSQVIGEIANTPMEYSFIDEKKL